MASTGSGNSSAGSKGGNVSSASQHQQKKMDTHLAFMSNMFPTQAAAVPVETAHAKQPSSSIMDNGASNSQNNGNVARMMVSARHPENRIPPSLTNGGMDTVQEESEKEISPFAGSSSSHILSTFGETASRLRFDDDQQHPMEENNTNSNVDDEEEDDASQSTVKNNDRRATIDAGAIRNMPNSSNNRRRSSPFFRSSSPARNKPQQQKPRKGRMSSPFRRRQQPPPPPSSMTQQRHSMSGMEITTIGRGLSCMGNTGATDLSMEEFVQKSSRVQSFIGSAWQHAKNATTQRHSLDGSDMKQKKRRRGGAGSSSTVSGGDDDMSIGSANTEPRQEQGGSEISVDDGSNQKLVREQTSEIWRLKRELEEMQREYQSLQTKHDSIKDELSASQEEGERARSAQRLAIENARQARDEADAAETTVSHMTTQLQALQTVVSETKKASQLLQQEHEHVERKVAQAETALLHKGAELVRMRSTLKQQQTQQELFDAMKQNWHRQQEKLQRQVSEQQKLVEQLERSNHESHALASSRLEQFQKLQGEWSDLSHRLEEETQSKLETQEAMMKLSESVSTLQAANKELHEQLQGQQTLHHESNMQQQDALNKSAEEALQLRIEMERLQEKVQKLEVTGRQGDKNKQRSPTLPPLPPKQAADPAHADQEFEQENQENKSAPNSGGKAKKKKNSCCSVCDRPAFGLMKSCLCGDPSCQKRAHLSCANRVKSSISVSYPGTPAPSLPLVLCGLAGNGALTSSKKPLGATNARAKANAINGGA